MDIRRIIITAMIYVAAMAHAVAQNRIDGMMENYSSHGMSKYTSAVERDPQTRKVRRVVNVLELNDTGIDDFIKAFRRESKSGNFTEKRDEDGLTLMLTVRGGRQNRIYMIRCTAPYTPERRDTGYAKAKITVIIKYG